MRAKMLFSCNNSAFSFRLTVLFISFEVSHENGNYKRSESHSRSDGFQYMEEALPGTNCPEVCTFRQEYRT